MGSEITPEVKRKCYQDNLKIKRAVINACLPPGPNAYNVYFMDLDPRYEYLEDMLTPTSDLK